MSLFMLEISKELKSTGQRFSGFAHEVGDSKEALERYIKDKYKVDLIPNDNFNFPYFTDGGFKYLAENETWKYDFFCYPINIITLNQ